MNNSGVEQLDKSQFYEAIFAKGSYETNYPEMGEEDRLQEGMKITPFKGIKINPEIIIEENKYVVIIYYPINRATWKIHKDSYRKKN